MSCPYRGCKGERAHPSPHLIEAAQIDAWEAAAAARTARRDYEAVVALFDQRPRLKLSAIRAAVERREELRVEALHRPDEP